MSKEGKEKKKGNSGQRPSNAAERNISTESRIELFNKHKYSELLRDYLHGIVNPMQATRMPDIGTLTPTGLLTFEETGSLTSDANGAVKFGLFPSYDCPLVVDTGTAQWGVNTGAGPTRYRFTQAGFQRGNIVSVRTVAFAFELKGAQSFNNATGSYAVAVVPRYNSSIAGWSVSALSQLPGSRMGTVPASTMEPFHYYGSLHSGMATGDDGDGGQKTDELFDPEQFRILSADSIPVLELTEPSLAAPGIVFASTGSPHSAEVFQFTVRYAYEVIVQNNSVPTDTLRPPMAAREIAPVITHPAIRAAISNDKGSRSSFLQNGLSWLWSHRGQIAGGAAKVASAVAPLLPLVL